MENEKKVMDMEELMLDYGEMTSFDFESASFKEVRELHKINESEYSNKPIPFKYGNFDLVDMIHSFITQSQEGAY